MVNSLKSILTKDVGIVIFLRDHYFVVFVVIQEELSLWENVCEAVTRSEPPVKRSGED